MKIILISLILTGLFQFAQKAQEKSLGIINGRAISLPKPEYPEEAKKFCASGKVEVEVTIDKNGDVIKAKAISGDELLRNSSVDTVKRAKFKWIEHSNAARMKGIIVYNFQSVNKCLKVEQIVNKKSIFLPKPVYPKSCRCEGIIRVRIVIDMDGKVVFASAYSGHPLLRIAAVEAARKAKFPPTLIDGPRLLIVAFLEYKFETDGKIST